MKMSAVHMVDQGVYLLEPDTMRGARFEADGQPLPVHRNGWVVQDPTSVVYVRQVPATVARYVAEDGSELTPEEWVAADAALRAGCTGEDGEVMYPSLEAEFNHRKFLQQWKAVYSEPATVREPVELEIIEIRRDSGDPDIVSLWNSTEVPRERCLYRVNLGAVEVAALREMCGAHGLAVDIPTHSHLRFAKIGDSFAFDDSWDKGRSFVGTAAECKEAKAAARARVADVVRKYRASKCTDAPPDVGYVVRQAKRAIDYLRGAQLKASSSGSLGGARKALNELIEKMAEVVA